MYGICAYSWLIFVVNAGKYTIHGSYGLYWLFNIDPYNGFLKSPHDWVVKPLTKP